MMFFEFVDSIADLGGPFEFEVSGRKFHLFLEPFKLLGQLLGIDHQVGLRPFGNLDLEVIEIFAAVERALDILYD